MTYSTESKQGVITVPCAPHLPVHSPQGWGLIITLPTQAALMGPRAVSRTVQLLPAKKRKSHSHRLIQVRMRLYQPAFREKWRLALPSRHRQVVESSAGPKLCSDEEPRSLQELLGGNGRFTKPRLDHCLHGLPVLLH